MDYEKKYEEALERAKEYLKEYYFEEAVKEIFPELKESEDEKMRNVAINACKYMVDNFENSTKQYEDAIAWLEKQAEVESKQGEQKPIEWDEYDEMYVSALIAIVGKDGATGKNLRDTLTGWLRCLKGRFKKD